MSGEPLSVASVIEKWRAEAAKHKEHGDCYRVGQGWGLEQCADELAVLLSVERTPMQASNEPLPFKTCPKCAVVLPCEAHGIIDYVDVPAHRQYIRRAKPRPMCLCGDVRDADCPQHGDADPLYDATPMQALRGAEPGPEIPRCQRDGVCDDDPRCSDCKPWLAEPTSSPPSPALREYVQHKAGCPAEIPGLYWDRRALPFTLRARLGDDPKPVCTCGLDAIVKSKTTNEQPVPALNALLDEIRDAATECRKSAGIPCQSEYAWHADTYDDWAVRLSLSLAVLKSEAQ